MSSSVMLTVGLELEEQQCQLVGDTAALATLQEHLLTTLDRFLCRQHKNTRARLTVKNIKDKVRADVIQYCKAHAALLSLAGPFRRLGGSHNSNTWKMATYVECLKAIVCQPRGGKLSHGSGCCLEWAQVEIKNYMKLVHVQLADAALGADNDLVIQAYSTEVTGLSPQKRCQQYQDELESWKEYRYEVEANKLGVGYTKVDCAGWDPDKGWYTDTDGGFNIGAGVALMVKARKAWMLFEDIIGIETGFDSCYQVLQQAQLVAVLQSAVFLPQQLSNPGKRPSSSDLQVACEDGLFPVGQPYSNQNPETMQQRQNMS
ncbi:predicted protein [Postia placenta Mad-698-R]|nr:predicted protein [Postia placenta Mad-698-R]